MGATIRHWETIKPTIGHGTSIIWNIFGQKAEGKPLAEAPLIGYQNFTLHLLQPHSEGDYHSHTTKEQIFYITRGKGKMNLDDKLIPVRAGDTIHIPPPTKHQIINDSEDWLEHLVITVLIPAQK
ncbi:MAG: cupin domain-containing protein [SAR202 cluster bacterium]|nr:cupin domain-containing protein [SAR202 cluster bacterium]